MVTKATELGFYHGGELAVQARAGVRGIAEMNERVIKTTINAGVQRFLQEQPMAFAASVDDLGRVWASVLAGLSGFMVAVDERTLHVDAVPPVTDPLHGNLQVNPNVGLLIMDFSTRRRLRLNGRAEVQPDGSFDVRALQVYGNCPKYIQARQVEVSEPVVQNPTDVRVADRLTAQQQQWISRADTFFVASAHPEAGADASHRGGDHGFVTVNSPTELTWPDYSGNSMFNTLGNITVNPRAGLLFLDFETGGTLQLTGEARVSWDAKQISQHRGAERLVSYQVTKVLEVPEALPLRWTFQEHSPFNP